MARNQVVNGSLVPANRVPAVTEVCRRHPLHWNRGRKSTLITQCASSPHLGHSKPLGHRAAITACAQAASVPKLRMNSGTDMPCWNWILFIAMAKLRRGMLPAYGAGSSAREPGLGSSLIRSPVDAITVPHSLRKACAVRRNVLTRTKPDALAKRGPPWPAALPIG